MKKMTKGQAALEFLTTYGWAFVVILVMIGAMAYFGVLNPKKILPDRCTFGTEVGCEDYLLDASSNVIHLRLKNNVRDVIILDSLNVTAEDGRTICSDDTDVTWKTGEIIEKQLSSCNLANFGIVSGAKGKVKVAIDYYLAKSSSTYSHVVEGDVFATVK